MKRVISLKRILSEYNKVAKVKISQYGAKILQEEAKRRAMETGNDAHIELSRFETKDGVPYVIS